MATKTLGTATTTTLTAVQWPSSYAGVALSAADIATISNLIFTTGPAQKLAKMIVPGAFSGEGLLFLPGKRGLIRIRPGDWIAVDAAGWPIVLGSDVVAATATATGNTHTTTTVDSLSANVLKLGWHSGMPIKSSNADIPAAAIITAIAANGLSLTLSAAATGTNAGGTITVGDFVHS